MGATTTAAISIDRFRRARRAGSADAATAAAQVAAQTPLVPGAELVGTVLGTIDRRYGLLSSEEAIHVSEVLAVSGDLAVADRLAFVASMERHTAIAVIEVDGWYLACATERALTTADLGALRMPAGGAPRIMSLATDRGITPALGPLVA
jgi:hypothetical protein